MKNYVLNSYDLEAAKRLEDFLPDCLFDAHMHISHNKETGGGHTSLEDYFSDTGLVLLAWASLVAQMASSLCWEDPLEKGIATLSSILAWRIP